MDQAGLELMRRMQSRTACIVEDARAGKTSPLLPSVSSHLDGVAAWRTRNHVRPQGQGVYLLCDACGESTARQANEEEAWEVAGTKGWRVYRDLDVCICERCVQSGNARALERVLCRLEARQSA